MITIQILDQLKDASGILIQMDTGKKEIAYLRVFALKDTLEEMTIVTMGIAVYIQVQRTMGSAISFRRYLTCSIWTNKVIQIIRIWKEWDITLQQQIIGLLYLCHFCNLLEIKSLQQEE